MDLNDNIHSAKSESIKFSNPIYSSSSTQVKDFKKLEKLVDGKKSPISEACNKCKFQFYKLVRVFQSNQKDFDEINRSQEHISQRGSTFQAQFKAFNQHVKTKGNEFDPLKKELKSYVPGDKFYGFLYETLQGIKSHVKGRSHLALARAHAMKAGVEKLKPGESVLIDAQVHGNNPKDPGHAMVMRLTHNENGTFKMEFANTGLGINNSQFHPKSSSEPHKYQTVALIQNIPREKLLEKNFFETYCQIANEGIIPSNSSLGTSEGSIKTKIDAIYLSLSTLGEPSVMPEDSNYYSRPQIGASCTASSIWAISKIILPEQSITDMENDIKLKSLLRNYKRIENGYDQSSTRKIMVLDQVESLKPIFKEDEKSVIVLNKLEEKLKADLGIERVESKVIQKGRVSIEDFLIKKDDELQGFSIKSMHAKLISKKMKLKFDVKWDASKNGIHYNIIGDLTNLAGKERADSMFLLYFAIANGDQKLCEKYIQQVLNQAPDDFTSEKNSDIQSCLWELIKDLSNSNTRSDIAKKCFLDLLMVLNNPDYEMDESLRSKYLAMDVEAHLPTDNIWVKGITELMARKKSDPQNSTI